jgi:colanic acid/amylovoran biosynthesis glycosyltransferase
MRVVIYDGTLKPPTFVQFLSEQLSMQGHQVYLAGKGNAVRLVSHKKLWLLPVGAPNKVWFLAQFCWVLLKAFWRPSVLLAAYRLVHTLTSTTQKMERFVLYGRLLLLKPDVLHVQWSEHVGYFEPLLGKGFFKCIVSFRGRQMNITPFVNTQVADMYHRLLPKVDGFHAVSEAILKNAVLFGADAKKSAVIRPAVSEKLLDVPSNGSRQPLNGEPLKLLSVGRMHWKKGYLYALEACRQLVDLGIDVQYTLIAGGDHEDLLFHIHDLNLQRNVKLVGRLAHHEVVAQYKQAHVFVLPSIEEGIANVVLEAMALGVPVISTHCGGMTEVLIDDENGWLVPYCNVGAIVEKVLHFLSLPHSQIDMMVENARKTIVANHLINQQVSRMLDLYVAEN